LKVPNRYAPPARPVDDKTPLIQPEHIEQVVLLIRGQRVMLNRLQVIPKDASNPGKTKAKRK
jgi:hypothetical protein